MKALQTILWIALLFTIIYFEIVMVYKYGRRQMRREQKANLTFKLKR